MESQDGRMPDLDLDPLLAPLASDGPCGVNLEYDPAFQALQDATAGKPERQYGDTVIPAEPPDWPAVHVQALALAARTRDLRVAVWLARSAARVDGLGAAVQGLQLLRGLLERYWEQVHPMLDSHDNNDPTARLNALYPLVHDDGLADLRAAALTSGRGAVTVRDLELAFARVDPLPGEAVPTEEGVTPAVASALAHSPQLAAAMAGGLEAAQGIAVVLEARLGAAQAPDLAPLLKLLQCVAQAGRRAQGEAPTQAHPADGAQAQSGANTKPIGAIQSREDAIRTLQRVCEWIERNEPSHPAPLLIQRAQRLMKKNFMEIIRDLAPEGLGQIEKLAGPGRE
jgi:type VI secretion system protein ImpA